MNAFVRTVTGDVAPDTLGLTLIHEHLLCDLSAPELRHHSSEPIAPEQAHDLRFGWGIDHPGHHRLDDLDVMTAELRAFASAGGGCVVDLTVRGIGQSPTGLRRLAETTGVAVVCGCGWYTDDRAGELIGDASAATLADRLVADLESGIDDTGVRAGLIGEIGCSWPLRATERRSLQAAARAQAETGAALNVHPGRAVAAPFEILDCLAQSGGNPARTIISHLDRTLRDPDDLARLADSGCGLEWDFFGIDGGYYPFAPIDLPHDGERLDHVQRLADRGHGAQLLVSHDICTLTRLRRWGGHGYAHLLTNGTTYMRRKGFDPALIRALLVDNPARFLAR
ncbi:MAG: aryldialkylphosphatase [Pseudomonadota bacterium]